MKTPLYNQKAEVIGEVELNSKIFEVKAKKHLLAEAARIQMSSARQGTAHTKTRGEVSGGGRKPWKQKGTGRARAGSTRSPIWRHGGVTFGPRNKRNWELKLNKTAKRAALFMALSDKVSGANFYVVDKMELPAIKTKDMVKIMEGFKQAVKTWGSNHVLVLTGKADEKLMRSARNIPSLNTILANSLNIIDVLKADNLIVLKDSLSIIEKTYLRSK